MKNFFKGIVVGLGGVAPGLSGSVLMVIFGLYQKTIECVSSILNFKKLKDNLKFLIPLGIGMEIPSGYEAWVVPRSSTPKHFGIIMANSIGIIDNSYNGDNDQWHFPAIAIKDTIIEKGDRICQFRIMVNQPKFFFEEVEHLNEVSRNGIGSTGKK